MELLQYWKVIRKSLWIIFLIVALGVGATGLLTLNQPRQYESSATLLLNPSMPGALVPYYQAQLATNLADSYTQLMRTRSFADAVVKELPFPMSADDVGRSLVTTRLRPNTLFYDIAVRTTDPGRSQQLADTVLKAFLESTVVQQQGNSNPAGDAAKIQMRDRLNTKLEYLSDQITSYQGKIDALEAQAPSKERDDQLLQLRSQLVSLQQTETDTMVGLAQIGDPSAEPETALVIDQPLPGKPVSSRMLTNLALAFAVSLLMSVGVAFLRDYLDYTIHSPEHLQEVLGLTPIAALGVVGEIGGRTAYGMRRKVKGEPGEEAGNLLLGHKLVTLDRPKSPESESFRGLRTNIQFSGMDKPIRTLAVTSSQPGEGKSFTASNLAVVMAQAGNRVILVDADLRKPSLHRLFELPNKEGFTNLMMSPTMQVEEVAQPVPRVHNLAVLTSGPIPPNPSELLNSQRAIAVMEQLAQQADIVIYDSPPGAVVTDPIILGTRVDAVILVINAGNTRRDMVGRVRKSLQNVGVTNILPVLNRVRLRDLQGYYYNYHYYGGETERLSARASSNGNGRHHDGKSAVVGSDEATATLASSKATGRRRE